MDPRFLDLLDGRVETGEWSEAEIHASLVEAVSREAFEPAMDALVRFMLGTISGKMKIFVLEGMSKIAVAGVNPAAACRFARGMLQGGVTGQRIYLILTIAEARAGNIGSLVLKEEILRGLLVIANRAAMLPVLDQFMRDEDFLHRCASTMADLGDYVTLSAMVGRYPSIKREFGAEASAKAVGASKGDVPTDVAAMVLEGIARQADESGDVAVALCTDLLSALGGSREAPVAFFNRVKRARAHGFRSIWVRVFQERSRPVLEHLRDELAIPETQSRMNFITQIGNIGDLAAYASYMEPLARGLGLELNIVVPDTSTCREIGGFYESELVHFHTASRAWLLATCKPWMETMPFAAGGLGTLFYGERPLSLHSKGPYNHRFDGVRNVLGLPPGTPCELTGRWREGGQLDAKLPRGALDNAVVIAPDSNSLRARVGTHTPYSVADLDLMWKRLASRLAAAGKTVIVNARNHGAVTTKYGGDVISADLTLSEFLQAVDRTGVLIAERSGLLDLLNASDAAAYAAIIYPKGFHYGGPVGDRDMATFLLDLHADAVDGEIGRLIDALPAPLPRKAARRA
jgi:hypothetical protein